MILEQSQGANTRGKGKEKKVSEEEVSTCRRGPTIGQSVDGHNGDNALQRVRLSQVCCGGKWGIRWWVPKRVCAMTGSVANG